MWSWGTAETVGRLGRLGGSAARRCTGSLRAAEPRSNRVACETDSYDRRHEMDEEMTPAQPAGEPDPMAMLAFLQRLVTTMSSGGDVDALMAEAPPGFQELFADAERRAAAGEVPDLGQLMGMFGAFEEEDGTGEDG